MSAENNPLLKEFVGTACRCGKSKQRGMTFCGRCYHALPVRMKRALYQRMGCGYEEAYEAAVAYLHGKPQPSVKGQA